MLLFLPAEWWGHLEGLWGFATAVQFPAPSLVSGFMVTMISIPIVSVFFSIILVMQ